MLAAAQRHERRLQQRNADPAPDCDRLGRPEVERSGRPVDVPFPRLVQLLQHVQEAESLPGLVAAVVVRLARDDLPALPVQSRDLFVGVAPVSVHVPVDPNVFRNAPAFRAIALVAEALAFGLSVRHGGDLRPAVIGPSRQGHGPIVEEELQRGGECVPLNAASTRELAVVGDPIGLQVRLQNCVPSGRIQTIERLNIRDRLEGDRGYLRSTRQPHLLAKCGAVHHRRVRCAGILRRARRSYPSCRRHPSAIR